MRDRKAVMGVAVGEVEGCLKVGATKYLIVIKADRLVGSPERTIVVRDI